MEHNQNAIGVIYHQRAIRIKFHDYSSRFYQSTEKTGRCREVILAVGDTL